MYDYGIDYIFKTYIPYPLYTRYYWDIAQYLRESFTPITVAFGENSIAKRSRV